MIRIRSLNKSFREPVLKDFSRSFPDRGLVLLRGASGSGKTTLLRLIAGLETPDSGAVEFSPGARISMVFQEARLLPFAPVRDNLRLVCPEKSEAEILEALAEFGVEDAASLLPGALSGGMRQRVNLARSCLYGGTVYLWDEPTKELDGENADRVIQKAQSLAREALVIAATHDDALIGGETIFL